MSYFPLSIDEGVTYLQQGSIIAYPTEAVFGLGCAPDNDSALDYLLALKQRDVRKGLILIASHVEQLLPYLDLSQVKQERWQMILQQWPGPYTWVIPASPLVSSRIKGQFTSVAVRVTAHPVASQLCQAFGKPIVSTSANIAMQAPLKDGVAVYRQFGEKIAGIVTGSIGADAQPTIICDALTEEIYRA